MDSDPPFREIGRRLRAYRLASGIGVEDIAGRLGVSRSAIYRYENGEVIKLDTIGRIAGLLETSVPSLLGVAVEYVTSAIAFFERLRQVEEEADQLTVLFGPVSYLLTSDAYDAVLAEVLNESLPATADRGELVTLMTILAQRKAAYRSNRPAILSLVPLPEIDRLLATGLVGRPDLPSSIRAARRAAAHREVEHIAALAARPPIGVQIGVVADSLPTSSFSIARRGRHHSTLMTSSFRLGEQPNIHIGVAMVTANPEAITVHARLVEDLWQRAATGEAAAHMLRDAVARCSEPIQ